MPTNESRVQQALLHPEAEIRRIALAYYAKSYSQDNTILPQVLQAVAHHGRGQMGYLLLREAVALPQTTATVGWLTGELSQPWDQSDPASDNYCLGLSQLLSAAPTELLRAEMAELVSFVEELREPFRQRLAMASWDWETAWQTLRTLLETSDVGTGLSLPQLHRAWQLTEVLAHHRHQAPWIVTQLEQHCAAESLAWREPIEQFLVDIAGRLRLSEAVPALIEGLDEDNLELYEECMTALTRIGGDTTVSLLAERWPQASPSLRLSVAELLENIHTPQALAVAQQLFQESEEPELLYVLGHALLGQCAEEALGPVREYVGQAVDAESVEEEDLRYHLVATATILGTPFPEYDDWYREAVEEQWGWPAEPPQRLRNALRVAYGWEPIDPDWEPSWDDEVLDEPLSPEEQEQLAAFVRRLEECDPTTLTALLQPTREPFSTPAVSDDPLLPGTFRREVSEVGRNDPCPCGSGKKYKRCCLPKQTKP